LPTTSVCRRKVYSPTTGISLSSSGAGISR
jgi:hypothetical protein